MSEYKPIPIGIEDFKEIIDKDYYFVDKTLIIKDILDSGSKVTLFTRPRRFGKTLNMSMLKRYFEKTKDDNSYLFEGLKIAGAGEKYRSYMRQYPVISISLKSMKQTSFEESFFEYQTLIIEEFEKNRYVLKYPGITSDERNQYEAICSRTAYKTSYATALRLLSKCLKKANKKMLLY